MGKKNHYSMEGRCEKYETDSRKNVQNNIPDLFRKRIELLTEGYVEPVVWKKTTIGIPRALMVYYQQFPFWRTFFEELGFTVLLSRESDKAIIHESIENISTETCLPVELIHGHVLDLVKKDVDYIFIPFIINGKEQKGNNTQNCNCPWVQTYSFMIKSALKGKVDESKLLFPALHFRYFEKALTRELTEYFSEKLGLDPLEIKKAIIKADSAQDIL